MMPIFKCMLLAHALFCTRAIFELFERKIDKYDANFWNVVFMCFLCTRAILNLLKRKIDKYVANF